jgi:hypothetical protein
MPNDLVARWHAAERCYDSELKELGIEASVPIAADDPKLHAFEQAWQKLQNELEEIRAVFPAPPRTPLGWEGPAPEAEIESIDDLIRFIEVELRQIQAMGRSRHWGWAYIQIAAESLLNAHRWLLEAGICQRPFPQRPSSVDDAERELANLLIWLQGVSKESEKKDGDVGSKGKRPKSSEEKGMPWRGAAERLLQLKRQGECFTSRAKMADRIGCSSSTVQRAIVGTEELRTWAAKAAPSGRPAAVGLSDSIADNVVQTREPIPGSQPTLDEANETLKRLVRETGPDDSSIMQQEFEAMEPEERIRIAAVYQNADDLGDRVLNRRA